MKSCKKGYYYCNKDEKCKKIPKGWHLMPSGYIMRDRDHEDKDEEKKKNGNGHHSNGNGDGSGESNGGSDGGGDGGGGVAEGWSAKYKKSIDCNNPKGFSQRAHCRGRKKMNEAKNGDHEVAMAQSQLAKAERNIAKLRKALGKKEKDIPAWMQAKITDTAHDTDAAAGYVDKINNVQEAVPLLAAPLAIPASKAIGAGLAATGLAGLIMQARKKSEDKKSQSADYGQEKPAKKKDETEEGITGKQIPKKKWKSPTKRRKFEQERRAQRIKRGEFEKLGDNFSSHRMTGSRGHGSQYEVNPRITYRHNEEVEQLEEARDGKSAKDKGYSLRDWFKGGGWVQAGGKYDGKPCAKQPGQKTKPFCRDADDRASMSKDERERRAKKKRREDPNPNRKGKAKMVTKESYSNWRADFSEGYADDGDVIRPTDRIKMLDGKVKTLKDIDKKIENKKKPLQKEEVVNEKKDACYHKVKSRYSVWPSAYASGALVKCRKVGAKNWGNKTKKEEFSNWRNDLEEMASEKKIDKKLQKPVKTKDFNPSKYVNDARLMPGHGIEKKIQDDYQYSNWRDDFTPTEYETTDLIKADPIQVPPSNLQKIEEAKKCWKGYKKTGTQKLFGKTYNRCEKIKKEHFDWRAELEEGAAWTKKEGKNKSGGLNEKGRKSYERENPGSDLKRPSKKVGNKRRASFCARMKGMKKKLTSKKTANDPNSRINKSLRAWNC